MGYTHYFSGLQCTEELADFARTAIALSDVAICGPSGSGTAVICKDRILLNGSAERDEDYESFVLPGYFYNSFCKTARRPYDKVLTAILIDAIVLKVSGWENISSNGTEEDWAKGGGIALFMRTAKEHYGLELDYGDIGDVLRTFLSRTEDEDYVTETNKAVATMIRHGYTHLPHSKQERWEHLIDPAGVFKEEDKNRLHSEQVDLPEASQPTPAAQSARGPLSVLDPYVHTEVVEIKYHSDQVERLKYIGGLKSDWVDLRAAEDVVMKEGEFALISLGISVKLPKGYEMIIVPRNSTFKNFGILQTNSMGVIDETYCGDNDIIRFPALAVRDTEIHVNDRICQFRIQKHQPPLQFEEKDHLSDQDRGGFGSTGKN